MMIASSLCTRLLCLSIDSSAQRLRRLELSCRVCLALQLCFAYRKVLTNLLEHLLAA